MNYVWRVIQLRDYPEQAGGVYFAIWDLSGNGGYISGEVPLVEWLPYNDLTQEILVDWVQKALSPEQVEAYEQSL